MRVFLTPRGAGIIDDVFEHTVVACLSQMERDLNAAVQDGRVVKSTKRSAQVQVLLYDTDCYLFLSKAKGRGKGREYYLGSIEKL